MSKGKWSWTETVKEDFKDEFNKDDNKSMKMVTCKVVEDSLLVEFATKEEAKEAAQTKLNDRFYAGATISVKYIDQSEFSEN